MSATLTKPSAPSTALPGTVVMQRMRKLLILALVSSLVYSMFVGASWGRCPGGSDGSGGFVDGSGNPTDVAPSCISLSLGPNPLIYVVIALIVIGALTSALKKARTEADALRYLDSAAAVISVLIVVCIVVSQIWFWNLPVDEWDGGPANFIYPFPFGSVTTVITPQTPY
jgi:hypothetical protein